MLLGCHCEFKPTPISVALTYTCGFQVTDPAYVAAYFSSKEAAAMKTSCFHLFIFLAKEWGRQSKLEASSLQSYCSWSRVIRDGDRKIIQGFLFIRY